MGGWDNLWRDETGADFNGIRLGAIPENLAGKTVLDLGGYDGSMARICLERGALQATVVDNRQWECYGWTEPDKNGSIIYVQGDIEDWTLPADFVICYNVIYHVKSPWTFVEHLQKLITKGGQLALCTSFVSGEEPMWRIWGPHDPNWKDDVYWKPTLPGLWKLLESTGWIVEGIGRAGDHVVVRCT